MAQQVWADRERSTEVQFDLNRAVKEEFECPSSCRWSGARDSDTIRPWPSPSRFPPGSPHRLRSRARPCSPSATSMAARPNWPSFCSRSRVWPREAKGKRRLIYLGDMINHGTRQRGRARPRGQERGGTRRRSYRPADGQPRDHDDAGGDRRPTCAQGRDHVALQAHGRPKAARPDGGAGGPRRRRMPTRRCSRRRWAKTSCTACRPCAPHVRLGNTLFVHAGLDPHADPRRVPCAALA